MDWTDQGLLLSARPHGESAAIIEVLTEAHGRHLGVVRGGAGRRLAPVLQPGAQLALVWRARLDQHIGAFAVEPLKLRAAAVLADADRLAGLSALCALAAFVLPEREPQPRLYPMSCDLADRISAGADWFGPWLRWERALLEEAGFGLDLSRCALTGATEGLTHVSPRTGRAVTAAAAGDWANRLLALPGVMLHPEMAADRADMAAGLALTGHFLAAVLAPALGDRPLPAARLRLAARFAQG
jgi:DNA repair protein RecO (recombination protein O)